MSVVNRKCQFCTRVEYFQARLKRKQNIVSPFSKAHVAFIPIILGACLMHIKMYLKIRKVIVNGNCKERQEL